MSQLKIFLIKMNVSILVNIILEQYFVFDHCLMVVKDQESNFTYRGNHQTVKISIDENVENYYNVIEKIIFEFQFGCQGFIIDTSEPTKMFEYIEEKIRHSLVRYNNRRYLIIVRENFEGMFRELPGLRYVPDLLFVVQINSDEFQLWSFNFMGKEDTIQFETVDTWFSGNKSFLDRCNLFPHNFRNQHGRVLKLACFSYPPYTYCERESQLDGYFGTELNLVMEFSKQHNLTPKFVYNIIEEEYWGALHPNWTGQGLMGIALRDEADIAFSAFFIWEFVNKYLDMSMTYMRSGITCLVPKPKLLDRWITPLLSFRVTLWIVVIVNFGLNAFLLFFIVRFYQRKFKIKADSISRKARFTLLGTFWVILKISLGQTHHNGNNSSRVIFAIFFLSYLVLNSTFFCGLASIMTVPRYDEPIDSLSSLANSDVEILGIFDDWTLSIKKIHEEPYERIVEHFRATSKEELRKLSKQDNYAFFLERLQYNNYGINDFFRDDVIENYHLMEGDVYWEYTQFYLRKSSVLAPRFNKFILRVLQSGLPSYWQMKAVNRFMDPRIQKIVSMLDDIENNQGDAVELKFSHIQGCFAFLFIGYLLSAAALVAERLIH